MTYVLEVHNLNVWFGKQQVVDGVSLTVAPGEIVALVGESGAGKTLTALAIGRLLPPAARWSANAIRCRGRDLHTMTNEALRDVLGAELTYIFQDPAACLNPVLTIGEQVMELLTSHGLRPAEARGRAIEALTAVQLPGPAAASGGGAATVGSPAALLTHYPHQLSGGMQQRVMLAMATIRQPAVLIADEPTTALDATTQAHILALLRQRRAEAGLSLLLITHDLLQVAPIADRIAVMADGRVVETAPTAQLYRAPQHPYTCELLRAMPAVGQGRWILS